jgi:hypothetical protein
VLLLLVLALPTVAQTLTLDPPGWFTVASAGTTNPSVIAPVGAVYRYWGTSGIAPGGTTYCDPQTSTGAPIIVRPSGCTVNGATVGDYAPYGNHSLEIQEQPTAFTVSVLTPGSPDPVPVTIPANGTIPAPTPTPSPTPAPTGYTIFLCISTAPVSVTVDGGAPTAYPLPLAMVIPGTHTTLAVPGYGCSVVTQ